MNDIMWGLTSKNAKNMGMALWGERVKVLKKKTDG
jgi:hypothetical protein